MSLLIMTFATQVPPNVFSLLTAHGVAEAIRARCWFRRDLRFYACDEKNILALPRSQVLRRDCFDDLDYYAQHERGQMSPEAFRSESTKRQSLGYHLYTLVQDGRLVFYAWLVDRQARSEDPLLGQVFFPPTDASIVFDCFTHPTDRGKGIYYRALCQMLHDARDIGQARQACMAAYADNRISCHVIEKLGFYYIGSMIKQRRLFKAHRCAVAVHHTFQTALL